MADPRSGEPAFSAADLESGSGAGPTARHEESLRVFHRLVERNPAATTYLEAAFRGRLHELALPALEVALESGDPLGIFLARALENEGEEELQLEILSRLDVPPYADSVPLSEVAVVVTRTALERCRRAGAESDHARQHEMARLHHDLAHRLAAVGSLEEACEHARRAVEIRRSLLRDEDGAAAILATSWVSLGSIESALGNRRRALEATRSGVEILRRLTAEPGGKHRLGLAQALFHLSRDHGLLRHLDQAEETARESVSLFRETRSDSPVVRLGMARALTNLGSALRELGRHREALAASEEVVRILRPMAAMDWHVYEPQLSMALYNLGNRLERLGLDAQAYEVTLEATEIRRGLVAFRPAAFSADLATSLMTLGNRLHRLGRNSEALASAREAEEIFERLASEDSRYLPLLGSALNNLGNRLRSSHDYEAALEAARKSVELRRHLASEEPGVFDHELAEGLANLGVKLGSLGRFDEAIEASREAARRFRALDAQAPGAFLEELAVAQVALRDHLTSAARRSEATEVAEDVVEIYRGLVSEGADHLRARLGRALTDLALSRSDVADFDGSSKAAEEALTQMRELVAEDPEAHLEDLAAALRSTAAGHVARGRGDLAVGDLQEAISILQQREGDLDSILELSSCYMNLGVCRASLGHFEAAVSASRRALELRLEIFPSRPERHRRPLAETCYNLASQLLELGRPREALDAVDQALAHYGEICRRHRSAADREALARSLKALILIPLGRAPEACRLVDRALEAQRAVKGRFASDHHRLAFVQLSTQWLVVSSVADPERDLLSVAVEAVKECRRLVKSSEIHRPLLAQNLRNLGSVHHTAGRIERALEAFRESHEDYRALCSREPAWTASLALTGRDFAIALAAAGRLEEAITVSSEALEQINSLELEGSEPAWVSALRSEHDEYMARRVASGS